MEEPTKEQRELFDKMMAGDEQAMNRLIEMYCKDNDVDMSNPFSLVVIISLFEALRKNPQFVETIRALLSAGISIDAITKSLEKRFLKIIENIKIEWEE